MKTQYIYRCKRGLQTYEATIYYHRGRWNLTIDLVAGRECLVEYERFNYWSLISAKLAMYFYFPYGTVKWQRIY